MHSSVSLSSPYFTRKYLKIILSANQIKVYVWYCFHVLIVSNYNFFYYLYILRSYFIRHGDETLENNSLKCFPKAIRIYMYIYQIYIYVYQILVIAQITMLIRLYCIYCINMEFSAAFLGAQVHAVCSPSKRGTGTQKVIEGRTSLLSESHSPGTGCPEGLWNLLLQRYTSPAWIPPYVTCCREPALVWALDLMFFQVLSSPYNSMLLWSPYPLCCLPVNFWLWILQGLCFASLCWLCESCTTNYVNAELLNKQYAEQFYSLMKDQFHIDSFIPNTTSSFGEDAKDVLIQFPIIYYF